MTNLAKRKVYRVIDRTDDVMLYTFLKPKAKNEKITDTYTLEELLKMADDRGSRTALELSETQLRCLLDELIAL